jgi:hypothetical protein
MEPNLRFMVLMLLVSLTASCVHWLLSKDKTKALGTFIFPIGLAVLTMIAAVVT